MARIGKSFVYQRDVVTAELKSRKTGIRMYHEWF